MRVLPWTVMFPALTMYWNESNIFWLPIARSKVGSWISDWRLSRYGIWMERSAAYTHFTASSNALRVAMAHMVGEMENAFW